MLHIPVNTTPDRSAISFLSGDELGPIHGVINGTIDESMAAFIITANRLLNELTTAYDFMVMSDTEEMEVFEQLYLDLMIRYDVLYASSIFRGGNDKTSAVNVLAIQNKLRTIRDAFADFKRVCTAKHLLTKPECESLVS